MQIWFILSQMTFILFEGKYNFVAVYFSFIPSINTNTACDNVFKRAKYQTILN